VALERGIALCLRDFSEERRIQFLEGGYNRKRPFFPHRIYYVPRAGPDALKLARRMRGIREPDALWEILLFAHGPVLDQFPDDLFFDDDLIWHQQQLGKPGHVAYACLAVSGEDLHGLNYVSDLVQRQSRVSAYRSRIENRFGGWHHILLNAVMNFAMENNLKRFYSPAADFVMSHTDQSRTVQRALFERVYDGAVNKQWLASKEGNWWVVDVVENRERVILGEKKHEPIEIGKTICVCHDIEAGLGHVGIDPRFVESANKTSTDSLERMLAIEEEMKVKATYNVVGCMLDEVREKIETRGHCIAFHSYDHNREVEQLARCRKVDYRIKGYRPPGSRLTRELTDENLCFRNFEWLASSASSLGFRMPRMENGIVKTPILFDDFDLYKGRLTYEEWERKALGLIEQHDFVTFSLHDCYAAHWLPFYRSFLEKVRRLGTLMTLNEVANEVILGNCA
jgi:hypothetical protein